MFTYDFPFFFCFSLHRELFWQPCAYQIYAKRSSNCDLTLRKKRKKINFFHHCPSIRASSPRVCPTFPPLLPDTLLTSAPSIIPFPLLSTSFLPSEFPSLSFSCFISSSLPYQLHRSSSLFPFIMAIYVSVYHISTRFLVSCPVPSCPVMSHPVPCNQTPVNLSGKYFLFIYFSKCDNSAIWCENQGGLHQRCFKNKRLSTFKGVIPSGGCANSQCCWE